MVSDSGQFHRRSVRLKGYDYRQAGAYFITLVTAGRKNIFGEIKDEAMVLNNTGILIAALWYTLPQHFMMACGDWVFMANRRHRKGS